MTRWARSKSALKHARQPEGATSWNEFVAQRRTSSLPEGQRGNQAINWSTEGNSKHPSLTVQGQRGIHRSLAQHWESAVSASSETKQMANSSKHLHRSDEETSKCDVGLARGREEEGNVASDARTVKQTAKGSDRLFDTSLDNRVKKQSGMLVKAKEGHEMESDVVELWNCEGDGAGSAIHTGERKTVTKKWKQMKAKKRDWTHLDTREGTPQSLLEEATKVGKERKGLKKVKGSETGDAVVEVSQNVVFQKRSKAKSNAAKETGARKTKVAKVCVEEGAKATAKELKSAENQHTAQTRRRSRNSGWQVTELRETQLGGDALKKDRTENTSVKTTSKVEGTADVTESSSVADGDAESADTTRLASRAKTTTWLQCVRKERENKGMVLLPAKAERRIYMMKKAMRQKGMSGEDIRLAVRRSRRKEELLFRRLLRKLCFKCRQPGHGVADCPLVTADAGEAMGVCFKCGSTEHFSSKCTVQTGTDNEFPYARCFICKQEGHISRKCPRNEKGIYPKGGHCNFCGAIDHFKADCPQMQKNKKKGDEEEVTAEVMDAFGSADAELAQPEISAEPARSKVVSF